MSRKNLISYYPLIFLSIIFLGINYLFAYFFLNPIIKHICINQLILIKLFFIYFWLSEIVFRKKTESDPNLQITLLLSKTFVALMFIMPFLLSDHFYKDHIALHFVINYFLYLIFIIVRRVDQF